MGKEFKLLLILFFKFLISYAILIGLYNLYLGYFNDTLKTCDPFTSMVSEQSVWLAKKMGISDIYSATKPPYPVAKIMSYKPLIKNDYYIATVNEGCNALSVLIVFTAFIIAFSTKWYKTLGYILFGLISLHLANISRIALLVYIKIYYPEYDKFAHDYLFPAIIYGTVIALWVLYVKLFLTKKTSDETN